MQRATALIIGAAGAMAGLVSPAQAAPVDEPICTDRPGKSDSPCSAPKQRWQLEIGLVDWTTDKSKGVRSTELDLGEFALKYGISDSAHVELDFTAFQRNRETGSRSISGIGNVTLKVKQMLTGKGAALTAAIIPSIELPTQKRAFGAKKVEYGLSLPLSYALPGSKWSLSTNPAVSRAPYSSGGGYHWNMAQSASVGLQATTKLSLSAEYWTKWEYERSGTIREASLEPSVSYAITNDLQIDSGVIFGLNRKTADVEVEAGVSVRF